MHIKSALALGFLPQLIAGYSIGRRGVDCSFEQTAMDGDTCEDFAGAWGTSVEDFKKLNPGVNCEKMAAGKYCVIGTVNDNDPTPTSTPSVPSTTQSTTTTQTPTQTCYPDPPENIQPGAVCGCDKWHLVKEGTTCDAIIDYEKINGSDFFKWNPEIGGKACTGLWKGYQVCVHGPGATKPTSTSKQPEPTCHPKTAPTPIQPGAVCKCDKWHQVKDGTTCDAIVKSENIYADDFYKWNPKIGGKTCSGLWKGYYVCVHVPGAKRPPTQPPCHPNAPKNVQPGATCKCKKWHLVKDAKTTCDAIIKYEHIKADNFYKWNPKIGGKKCDGLWKGYNVCVGV
ncbi:hypothetical protein NLG97_g2306 [Lecanicillium saksenae]|uniref:Uncharacterized protein n=1 Tax=Lecanicillium saksenae TaxID=468837 RepID=A0ACC1R4P5_9HYPO|nr:hypothetical protein NLG97_g2306 [Lecanicillium saksenae]